MRFMMLSIFATSFETDGLRVPGRPTNILRTTDYKTAALSNNVVAVTGTDVRSDTKQITHCLAQERNL
jgi:hypothetical protein